MSRDDRNRIEGLDLIERRDPLLLAFGVRLAQVEMNIVIDGVGAV